MSDNASDVSNIQGVRQLLYDREKVDRGRRTESNGFWNIKIP